MLGVHVLSVTRLLVEAMSAPASAPAAAPAAEPSVAAQLAIELQRNRELTRTLYALRGEPTPNDVA